MIVSVYMTIQGAQFGIHLETWNLIDNLFPSRIWYLFGNLACQKYLFLVTITILMINILKLPFLYQKYENSIP